MTINKDTRIILSYVETPEDKGLYKPLKGRQESLFFRAWMDIKGTRRRRKVTKKKRGKKIYLGNSSRNWGGGLQRKPNTMKKRHRGRGGRAV